MLLSTIEFLRVTFESCVFILPLYKIAFVCLDKTHCFHWQSCRKAFTLLSTSSHSLGSYIWHRQVRISTKSRMKIHENIAKPFPCMLLDDTILVVWRLCNWSYNTWLLSKRVSNRSSRKGLLFVSTITKSICSQEPYVSASITALRTGFQLNCWPTYVHLEVIPL